MEVSIDTRCYKKTIHTVRNVVCGQSSLGVGWQLAHAKTPGAMRCTEHDNQQAKMVLHTMKHEVSDLPSRHYTFPL